METVSYANMIATMIGSATMTGGPTITTPQITRPGIASPKRDVSGDVAKNPLYRVVLLDDDDHTYDYVIEMLQKIFIFTAEQALNHAQEVDSTGRTVLITCELPEAEFARDQVHSYGRDWRLPRSQGSMSAIVEPAGDSA
jgi:ATP-dependent Clp protease adaptor protein ClpS